MQALCSAPSTSYQHFPGCQQDAAQGKQPKRSEGPRARWEGGKATEQA